MQSRTTRGVRRLLVSTGVISLVLSVAAPAALAAGQPEGVAEKKNDRLVEETGELGTVAPSEVGKVFVCHENNGTKEINLIEVSDNSVDSGDGKGGHEVGERIGDLEDAVAGLDIEYRELVDSLQIDFKKPSRADLRALTPHLCLVAAPTTPVETGGGQTGDIGNGTGNDGVGNGNGGGQTDSDSDGAGTGTDGQTPGAGTGTPATSGAQPETDAETVVKVKPAPPVTPAEPAQPLPEQAGPKPVIIISTDTVTKPAPAAAGPVVLPDAVNRQPQVLGSVTTRTPGSVTHTGVTALAATGTSTTTVLAALGSLLLLAGLGLQLLGRRHDTASALGA